MSDISARDSSAPKPDMTSQHFGTHRLTPWREALRAFGAQLVPRRFTLLGSVLNWPIWRLSLVGHPGPVDLEPYPGFRLRLYPRENHADTECYARPGLVDLPEEKAIARCAAASPDGDFCVVDVGSNTGTYAILCASLARQKGKSPRLICIEANPVTQRRFATNLRFSGLASQTRLMACAVSDAPGTLYLRQPRWNLGCVSVQDAPKKQIGRYTPTTSVPARTLLSLLDDAKLPRVDFLKIDIEGHEVRALTPFFQNAPKALYPRMILAETKHDKDNALSTLIRSAGYRITYQGRSDTVFERAL
ncbi:MAG: FkbM family methyltransferase [Pseudomonadota bacterium]